MRASIAHAVAFLTPWVLDSSAFAAEGCPPAVRLQGEGDLTARARALISPAIRVAGRDELPVGCPVTDAWVSPAEHGVMLVLESPWGVEARAVQSVELAVALLESWSVDAPTGSTPESGSHPSPLVLEPEARDPPPVRRLSVAAQLELSHASGRAWSTGASASVGPIFFDRLRPFLSLRGASGFGFPEYYAPKAAGELALLRRSSGELELLVGLELDLRWTSGLTWSVGAAGGVAWMSVSQDSALPGRAPNARSFVDARLEGRTALGYALDDRWSIELFVSLAPMRDLSRVLLPAADPPLDYEGVLPIVRTGLGVRWAFGTPGETPEQSSDDGWSEDPSDSMRAF